MVDQLLIFDIKQTIKSIISDVLHTELTTDQQIDYCVMLLEELFEKKYIYREYVKQYVHYIFNEDSTQTITNPYIMNYTCDERLIQDLQLLDQPEQRSPEWFAFRSERLTASDIATALNENAYCKPNELILKKCGIKKPFQMNAACQHGVKYEPVSCMLYEYYEKKKVYEFGCISHKYYNFLGASPDGICSDGTMLEIKNPLSRKIIGIPPKYYWIQMQIQMEVFNLFQCDYLECKMTEYFDYEEYEDDSIPYERKGCLVEYITSDNYKEPKYEYCPIAHPEPLKWVEEQQKKFDALPNSMYDLRVIWWKVDIYSCERIYRDTQWFSRVLPELATFWDRVVNYRRDKTYTKLIPVVKKRAKVCKLLVDSESDSEKKYLMDVDVGIDDNENIRNEPKIGIMNYTKPIGKCLI